MSKSQRVNLSHRLAIAHLVRDCRDGGEDATAWQQRLLIGVRELVGGMIVAVGPAPPHQKPIAEGAMADWVGQQIGGGWPSDAVQARWNSMVANQEVLRHHPGVAGFMQRPEPTITLTRREIVSDSVWEESPFVNEVLRADGMDEGLIGRVGLDHVSCDYCYTVVRAKGERPFPFRASAIVSALFDELAPHLGRGLLLTTQPNRHGLSPRLLEVLDSLLDGDSEKETAKRLQLRASTVHGYVKRLYSHFGVGTRAELLAYFLKRYRN